MREQSTPMRQCLRCKQYLPNDAFDRVYRKRGTSDWNRRCRSCRASRLAQQAWRDTEPNPSGLCLCGCGETTTKANRTSVKAQTIRGKHNRYVAGHQQRKSPVPYVVQDCGYKTPCWVWQMAKDGKGYGQRSHNKRLVAAHRIYYERHIGPIPEGLELDHLCRVRACVNPAHLEPVTHLENIRRSITA